MAADTSAAPPSNSSKGLGAGLTKKVGPLPVWGWAVAGFGLYWWYTHYGPGASSSSTASAQPGAGVTVGNITQTLRGGGAAGSSSTTTTTGAGTVAVPNVVGKTDTVGDAAIVAAGLKVHDVNEKAGGSGGSTKITAQSPAGGTMVAPGSTVSITLAAPAKKTTTAKTSSKTSKGKTVRTASTAAKPTGPPVALPPSTATTPAASSSSTTTSTPATGGGSQAVNVYQPESGYQYVPQTGGPVSADTGGPVYWEWQHAHRGPQVPEPVLAYAPQTNGAIYGPAVDVGPPGESVASVAQSGSGATTG